MPQYFSHLLTANLAIYLIASLLAVYIFIKPKVTLLKTHNIFIIAAFVLHTVVLVIRGIYLGYAPMASLFDSLLFYTWSVSMVAVAMYFRYKEESLSLLAGPVVFISLLKAYGATQALHSLSPSLQTYWFEIHVGACFIAYGFFTIGFNAGVLYLLKMRNKAKICQFTSELTIIEKLVYRLGAWGFFTFTVAMTSGGIWAFLAWTNYYIWTPKELFSVVLWIYYSTYLHARFAPRWQGKRTALISIFGFFLVVFTYLGVSLLMKSSHTF